MGIITILNNNCVVNDDDDITSCIHDKSQKKQSVGKRVRHSAH